MTLGKVDNSSGHFDDRRNITKFGCLVMKNFRGYSSRSPKYCFSKAIGQMALSALNSPILVRRNFDKCPPDCRAFPKSNAKERI